MLIGLNATKAKIDSEIEGLKLSLQYGEPNPRGKRYRNALRGADHPPAKRRMSKEGRKRIVAAQKKRWAAAKKAKKPTPKPAAKKAPVKKQTAKQ
jgi:hypothetical protein